MTADRSRAPRADARAATIMQAALDLARESGRARLSVEAVAARAGVGKHTVYRRWPSKGLLFLDMVLSRNEPLEPPDTGDAMADLRQRIHAAVDLLGDPAWGPLYQALLGEARHDPTVAAGLNERLIHPEAAKTIARLRTAREQGQVSSGFDLDLAVSLLSGPLYFRFLITREPLTHDHIDRVIDALFTGMAPRP